MGSLRDDYALILEGAGYAELALARNLLEEAGIPCIAQATLFETAAQHVLGISSMPSGDL